MENGLRWGAALALVFVVSAAQAQRMEHNAFLRKPVFTTEALVDQVRSDPVVLKRFERHFKMDKEALAEQFKGLTLRPLAKTDRYLVYNVDENYVIRSRRLLMKRGTLVFVDETGKPVLKRTCGNPMVSSLAPVGKTSPMIQMTPVTEEAMVVEPPEVFAQVSEPPNLLESALEPEMPTMEQIVPPEETLQAIVTPPPAPPIVPPAAFAPPLWPLLGLPFLIPPGGGNTPTPPPVPEPASMLVLGGGALALLARRRKKSAE